MIERHEQAEARRGLLTLHATHAAAAPLVSKEGGKVFDRLVSHLMRIIRPRTQQPSLFDRILDRAGVDRDKAA